LKFLLTEGEKILIVGSAQFESSVQAEFSLVASLIGLVARFIFQPAEEAAYIVFSGSKQSDLATLRQWLQAVLAIGFSAIVFSQLCGANFILIVYKEKWSTESCTYLLHAYCIYCFFMAYNGISEAYAFAKAPPEVLKFLRNLMLVNSVSYIGLSYFLS